MRWSTLSAARLGGHLLALGADRRQAQGLQVVAQQHEGLRFEGLHGGAPFCSRRDLRREGCAVRSDAEALAAGSVAGRPGSAQPMAVRAR